MRPSPHPMTLRQLQYVAAVAEARSFRRAAQACRVSQPSLSAQVALVEQALGVVLFERDQRGVVVTPAGEAVLERVRALLLAADDLVETAHRHADPFAGVVRIGVIPTVAPYFLPHAAAVLRERYPKLAFEWSEARTATLRARLEAAELDAALVALEAEIGDPARVVLGRDPFVLAAAPGDELARAARPVRPEELAGRRVLVLDDGHCLGAQVLAFCAHTGADEASFRATSLATLTQLVAGGGAVTLLPALALEVENRAGTLRTRTIAPDPPARTLALVWRRRSPLEVTLRPVGESLKAAYGQLVEEREARAVRGRR